MPLEIPPFNNHPKYLIKQQLQVPCHQRIGVSLQDWLNTSKHKYGQIVILILTHLKSLGVHPDKVKNNYIINRMAVNYLAGKMTIDQINEQIALIILENC